MPEERFPEDYYKYDISNMRQTIVGTPSLAEQGYKLVEAVDLGKAKGKYTSVIIAGMGGSSIAGLLLKSYLADEGILIHIVQDYYLPSWANKQTLMIACSYSGNTEETLSAFKDARRRGLNVVALATGGKLEEFTRVSRIQTILLPVGMQPRAAMAVQFFALLRLLEKLRIVDSKAGEVLKLKEHLKPQMQTLEKKCYCSFRKTRGKNTFNLYKQKI